MSNPQQFKPPMKNGTSPGPSGTSGKATASLILGLVSIVGMCFTGIIGLVLGIIALGDISKSNGRLGGKGIATAGIVLSSLGILWTLMAFVMVGMLVPAVAQVRSAARRATSANNVQQLVLSMHNYESEHREFPKMEKDGLSWRVHMLPYLEHNQLYSQFHLDEPWDSAHNIQLIDQMPPVYTNANAETPPGFTVYQVPYTDIASNSTLQGAAMFDNSGQDVGFSQITDGTSNTIAIVGVDAAAAVEWTRPADWEFDTSNPTHDLGANSPGGITLVAFADGSVQSINVDQVGPETMKALITRNGDDNNGMLNY